MTPNHTPGPWRAVRPADFGECYQVEALDGMLVADCHLSEADAHVVAAAPDLLDALRSVMGTLNYYIGPAARTAVDREKRKWFDACRAAIEKATGSAS